MALLASAGSLYQVNSTGGSTVWGVGTGGGGAADGVNIVSMATATSGGGTGGTTYSNTTGTIGIYAGSNVTLSQSNNAIVIYGPSPAAASLAISAGSTSSSNTGITFAQSNNVGLSYNGTQVWGNAWINASGGTTSANVSRITFRDLNGVSFGASVNGFSGTITASIPQYSVYFSDNSLATWSQSTNGSSTSVYLQSVVGGGGGGTGGAGISAGTQSVNSGTVVFSNSNSISFGLSGSTRLTASLYGHSLVIDTAGASGNVTFGTSTATNSTGATTTLYASAAGGGGAGGIAVSMGAGTSLSGTTLGSRQVISTNTVAFFAGSNVYLSQTSNSFVWIAPGIQVAAGSQTLSTTGPLNFVNSNSITFGMSGSSQITGSLYGNSLSFGGGGNIVFGTATTTNATGGSTTVTASYSQTGGAGGLGTVGLSAKGGSSAFTTLSFKDAHGVGFSNEGGLVAIDAITLQGYALGNTTHSSSGTFPHSAISFYGSDNISVGVTGGSVVIKGGAGGAGVTPALSGSNGSFSYSTATFGNLNGLSFYTSNGSFVGSYTVPTQTNQTGNIYGSSQTTGASSSSSYDHRSLTIVGAGANSVGWTNGSLIISAPNTVAQTVQSLGIYGSSQTTGQSSSSTHDARSLSLVGAGAVSVGWSNSSLLISAPNTIAQTVQSLGIYGSSQTTGASSSSTYDARSLTIVGQGANSVGWTNGSLVISAPNTIAQSNQTGNIYGSSQTTGASSSSSYDHRSLTIVGAGANSIGWTNGSLIISAPNTIAQTNQSLGIYMTGANTVGNSSSSTHDARTLIFSGQGVVSIGWSNGTVQISAPSAAGDGVNIVSMLSSTTGGKTSGATFSSSAGSIGFMAGSGIGLSQTSNTIVVQAVPNSLIFQNSNNITFGTATASDATGYSTSITASMAMMSAGMSTMGSTAGTTGLVTGALYLVGSGEIALSQSVNGGNATVTIYEPQVYQSFYELPVGGATTTFAPTQGTFFLQPFYLNDVYSFARGNMIRDMTTQKTSSQSYSWSFSGGNAGSSGTGQFGSTQTIMLFSRQSTGTAANSSNLISFFSTSNTMSMGMFASVSWAANVSSATMSVSTSNAFGFAFSQIGSNGAVTSGSTSSSGSTTASSTTTNANTSSSSYGNSFASAYFSSVRAQAFPFGVTMPSGEYWLGVQESTSSASTNYSLQNLVNLGLVQVLGFTSNTFGYIDIGTQIATTANSNIVQGWGSGAISGVTTTTFPITSISNMSQARTYYAFYGNSK